MIQKEPFPVYLKNEIDKVKGTYYPVRAGILRCFLIKEAKYERLHPNPNDEFCFPNIGPNYEIVSRYEQEYRIVGNELRGPVFLRSDIREPLMVEKTRPEGYMILNGHHRWAAAYRAGLSKLPIKIVDLTQEKDIRRMLQFSKSRRRATLDLDEVIFRPEDDPCLEKPLPFPANRFYRERVRLGVPALLHALRRDGWDIWVYTERFCSVRYIRQFFLHYRIFLTGIVTGTARKGPPGTDTMKELNRLLETKYDSTMHIDDSMVLFTSRDSRAFEKLPLSGSPRTWSREIIELIEKRKRNEQR